MAGFENPERLGAFVHSVCKNVLLEMFRKGKRDVSYDDYDGFDAPATTKDVDRGLVDRDARRLVGEVLRVLSDRDVEILKLWFLRDMDRDEVCRQMGVRRDNLPGLVFRAISRAKRVVRRYLGNWERRYDFL